MRYQINHPLVVASVAVSYGFMAFAALCAATWAGYFFGYPLLGHIPAALFVTACFLINPSAQSKIGGVLTVLTSAGTLLHAGTPQVVLPVSIVTAVLLAMTLLSIAIISFEVWVAAFEEENLRNEQRELDEAYADYHDYLDRVEGIKKW